eukprot:TRINITY_DN82558_c0_g1_i1.p1 TRINITY_DN82558_c0_g1~~TRINITY_DN82558_c0_g1_i1.p1  ORF type:complete len:433 (+),score=116.77 TRINITY_DN82558_c0_g1_i1:56-1354(+)
MQRAAGRLAFRAAASRAPRLLGAPAVRLQRRFEAQTTRFAGLKDDVEIVSDVDFRTAGVHIPVLRLLGEDGHLLPGASLPFTLDEGLKMYKSMLIVNVMDQVLNALQRQGRISFYMTSGGEEAASVGSIAGMEMTDPVWPQYRELGAFIHRGFTIQQAVDQCMSKLTDPGKGRQMPVHYVDANLSLQAVTSPLGTQIPQAVGAGYAFRAAGEKKCTASYFGDGAASEGDFAVALNFAATLKSQTIFLCRNNGWAISTPSSEQYAGDGIAIRGLAYGIDTIRVDGNDLAAVYLATKQARKLCVEEQKPVVIEMMTYRRGHHSTSDDSSQYRGGQEVKTHGREGLEPISRMKLLLTREGIWDDAKEEEFRAATKDELMGALRKGEAKKFAPVKDMFEDVWEKPTQQLEQQKKELFEHIEKHRSHYAEKLQKFAE